MKITSKQLSEALQDAWNDYCSDTGCHPDEFFIIPPKKKYKIHARFGGVFTVDAANKLNQIIAESSSNLVSTKGGIE